MPPLWYSKVVYLSRSVTTLSMSFPWFFCSCVEKIQMDIQYCPQKPTCFTSKSHFPHFRFRMSCFSSFLNTKHIFPTIFTTYKSHIRGTSSHFFHKVYLFLHLPFKEDALEISGNGAIHEDREHRARKGGRFVVQKHLDESSLRYFESPNEDF